MHLGTATDASWVWVWRLLAVAAVLLAGLLFVLFMTQMPGRSYRGTLAPLSEHEKVLRDELRAHVEMLAGTIGERNMFQLRALRAAADYVRTAFLAMGYSEVNDQAFRTHGEELRNLEVELRGGAKAEEIVLIGAHYDSIVGSPGANDNASGVAALLALARRARELKPSRTVRFVAFVNEEPPFFLGGEMGSQFYARAAKKRGDKIVVMVSLETIGCYSDVKGSQSYPAPFSFFYPTTGNFVGFVGNLASRGLVRRVISLFRQGAKFPSEGVAAPAFIPGIGWSDHWSFWQEGYPGVMVTDTALFRYKEYHTHLDRPEILDYDRLARVVAGLKHLLVGLAE